MAKKGIFADVQRKNSIDFRLKIQYLYPENGFNLMKSVDCQI